MSFTSTKRQKRTLSFYKTIQAVKQHQEVNRVFLLDGDQDPVKTGNWTAKCAQSEAQKSENVLEAKKMPIWMGVNKNDVNLLEVMLFPVIIRLVFIKKFQNNPLFSEHH